MTTTPATQSLLPVTPTRADHDAANAAMDAMEQALGNRRSVLARAFARHRQAHSIPGDVGTLLDCIRREGLWGHPGLHAAVQAVAALTPSALSGSDYTEAFDILVDVQSALVLTADHSQGATVASFVSSSTQYERLNRFLHERQHADPRSASALSGDAGEGE